MKRHILGHTSLKVVRSGSLNIIGLKKTLNISSDDELRGQIMMLICISKFAKIGHNTKI